MELFDTLKSAVQRLLGKQEENKLHKVSDEERKSTSHVPGIGEKTAMAVEPIMKWQKTMSDEAAPVSRSTCSRIRLLPAGRQKL